MIAIFVGLVFVGLLLGVRVMLFGVERQRDADDAKPRSFSLIPAATVAFCLTTGVVGYLLVRQSATPVVLWGVALGTGVIAAFAATRIVMKWWTIVPEHDVDDERYVLQGSLGKVIADIDEGSIGKVSTLSAAGPRVYPARAVDQQRMAIGTEVVIERVEDGIAFVEDWAEVEKRL